MFSESCLSVKFSHRYRLGGVSSCASWNSVELRVSLIGLMNIHDEKRRLFMIRVGSSSGGGSTRTTTASTVLLVRGREKERMERKGSALIVSPSLIARWARLTRCTLSPETDRRTNQFPLVYLTFLFPHLTALDYSSRPLTSSLSLPGKTSIIHTDRPPLDWLCSPLFFVPNQVLQ